LPKEVVPGNRKEIIMKKMHLINIEKQMRQTLPEEFSFFIEVK